MFQWPKEWARTVVDKHSTGGVGDKVKLTTSHLVSISICMSVGLHEYCTQVRAHAHVCHSCDLKPINICSSSSSWLANKYKNGPYYIECLLRIQNISSLCSQITSEQSTAFILGATCRCPWSLRQHWQHADCTCLWSLVEDWTLLEAHWTSWKPSRASTLVCPGRTCSGPWPQWAVSLWVRQPIWCLLTNCSTLCVTPRPL